MLQYAHIYKNPCLVRPDQKLKKERSSIFTAFLELLWTIADTKPRLAGKSLIMDVPHKTYEELT